MAARPDHLKAKADEEREGGEKKRGKNSHAEKAAHVTRLLGPS